MKKKLLLCLAITCVLMCLFALCVGAETVVSENNIDANGDIIANSLGSYTIDNSSQNVSSIDITYKTEAGETKEGKFYIVTNIWGSNRQMHSTYIPSDFDMSQMVYMPDKIDVNDDGTYSYNEKITGTQGDKNLYYKYSSYNEGVFSDTVDVKKQLVKVSYSTYLEYFGSAAYNKIPLTTLTYNGKEAVEGTFFVSPIVREFYGGNNNSSFGGSASGNINGETGKFTRLVFERREGAVSFGQYCFCRNVIEEVVFLGGTYNLRNDAIAYLWEEGTNTPCLKRVVVESGAVLKSTISLNVGTYDVVFIGSEADYSEAEFSSYLVNATGNVIFEDICYVYGHKTENDNDCTTALVCSECGEVLENAYDAHDAKTTIEYKNGYGSIGYKNISCQRCGYNETTEVPALFVNLGFSAAQYGDMMSVNYKVNAGAIAEYEKITDEVVNYGVFAVKAETIGTNDIFDENGDERQGVIAADLTDAGFGLVNLKIMGFDEDQKKIPLAMGAYVGITKDGEIEYSYLQIDEPTNGKYYLASYNDVVALLKEENI